jgi:hypothetical protein
MAVLADTGAALIVIGNGMRLLRYRADAHEPLEAVPAHSYRTSSAA